MDSIVKSNRDQSNFDLNGGFKEDKAVEKLSKELLDNSLSNRAQ